MFFRKELDSAEISFDNTDLKLKSVKNGFINLLGQIISFGVTITTTVVLARLLSPDDYGLIAIVTAFYAFFLVFSDFGFSVSLIRKQDLVNSEVSTMLWLNNLISLSFTILFFIFSFFIANIYEDNRLDLIIQVFSIVFIIGGLSAVHNAILIRQMKFKIIVLANIISAITGMTIAIASAFYGLGYWALVINILVVTLVKSIYLIKYLNWYPKFEWNKKYIKEHFNFGKDLTAFNLVNYFSRNLDNLLIGKFYSLDLLGFYSKAYQLLLMPVQQIRGPIYNVSMPVLSSLKNDKEK